MGLGASQTRASRARGAPLIKIFGVFLAKVPNIFQDYFSVKATLALSFHDVVFSKGVFLDDKNGILL